MTVEAPRRWYRRLRPLVTTVPFLVAFGVALVLFVSYTLAGFFLVPRLERTHVPRNVQEQLKRRAEIGEVRVNPLLFKVEAKHFRLQEADGRPLIAFDRLFVDFELSSLFRRAWTFADIQIEAPRLDVVLTRDGRLNLADLLDSLPRGEPAAPPSPTTPTRMLLQHALVSGGVISFTDLSGRAPQQATVQPINIELREITTLPERRGPYAISATLAGGGVVGWEGEVSLVPLGSTGHLGLRGFPLATAWRFVQDNIAVAEPAGQLDAAARYQFAYRDGQTTLKVDGVDVTIAGLGLTEPDQKSPLLALETVRLTGARGDVIAREVTVPDISVSRGRIAATMGRDGTVNWQKLVVASPTAPTDTVTPEPRVTQPGAAPDTRPWRVGVEKIRLEQIALSFTDQSRAAPLAVDVGDLTVGLSAKLETGPGGLAGIAENLGVKIARVAVSEAAGAKARVLALDQISLDGGRIDLGARQIGVAGLAVTGGTTTVIRAADGSIPLVTMLGPAQQGKPTPPGAIARQ
jgi:uncharacterized protein involved in outer membrane biogenesis